MSFGMVAAVVGVAGVAASAYSANKSSQAMSDASRNASEAAQATGELGYQLGQDQLAEARRQYDLNMGVIKPVVDAQLATMNETLAQARDSYAYSKTFRDLEGDLLGVAKDWAGQGALHKAEREEISGLARSNAGTLQSRAVNFENEQIRDLGLYTGGNSGIAAKYGADIDAEVAGAVADARAGQAQAQNSAIRQAMRYGLSVPANLSGVTMQGASQIASAANTTRNSATDRYRQLIGQGISLRGDQFKISQTAIGDAMTRDETALTAKRNQRIQDDAVLWGRGLDVAGLGRGMTGVSQGAYGLATTAGTNAVNNQVTGGNQLLAGVNQGNQTILSGAQIAQGGLNSVLGNATNAAAQHTDGMNSISGLGVGFAASMASQYANKKGAAASDRRLKRDVVRVADDPRGFGWYEFQYVWGGPRVVGVMADEVEAVMPQAVTRFGRFAAVDYSAL